MRLKPQPAFTLVETLIAMVIAVVLLGAGVMTNQAIRTNAVEGEATSQMNALADDAIGSFRLLRDASPATPIGTLLGFSSGNTVYGAFHTNIRSGGSGDQVRLPSGCTSSCRDVELGGPLLVRWCSSNDATTDCPNVVSPVGPAGCPAMCRMNDVFDEELPGIDEPGELVGVRRIPYPNCTTACERNRQVLDASNPLTAVGETTIFKMSDAEANNWDVYVRRIKIIRGDSLTFKVDLSQGTATGSETTLRGATYQIIVTVNDYRNPNNSVQKSAILTDW